MRSGSLRDRHITFIETIVSTFLIISLLALALLDGRLKIVQVSDARALDPDIAARRKWKQHVFDSGFARDAATVVV